MANDGRGRPDTRDLLFDPGVRTLHGVGATRGLPTAGTAFGSSDESDDGLVRLDSDVKEESQEELKEPDMWDVVLHNDNYTTKVFVVEILRTVFHKSAIEATKIMMQVHKHGRGVIGTYTYDVAQTKVDRVHALAKEREYPLRCAIEKANN